MPITITKVKFKNGTLHYRYEQEHNGGEPDKHDIEAHDAPLPSFEEAWNMLAGAIAREAEFPMQWANDITPSGLTISHYDDGRWGATISGLKRLENSNCPLIVNTPHKPESPTDGNPNDTNILDEHTVMEIEDVLRETEKYIKGQRKQGMLKLAV